MTSARRVAHRYRLAQEAEQALDMLADHWVDEFLDTFVAELDISKGTVEEALETSGVSEEDIQELATKTAGAGMNILHGIWELITDPFIAIAKLIRSSEFRATIKKSFKRALWHEARASRHMLEVAWRLAHGEEIRPEERKAAMHQLVDILTKTVLLFFVGPHIAHMFFGGGIWKALGALASPVDEILTILIDKPLRKAAKRLLGADIGLLPSGFYTHFKK